MISRNGAQFDTIDTYSIYREANNVHSTDNVPSEMGIDWTNPWIAVQSFTDPFREILIFNHFDNHQGQHLCLRKKEKKEYKDKLVVEKFPGCHQVLSWPQIIMSSTITIYLL